MKRAFTLVAVLVAIACSVAAVASEPAGDWGPTNQGVRLRLRVDQPVVKQGQDVMLSIDLQSVGAARMYYYDSDTWSDYPLTVLGPTGAALEPLRDLGIIYRRIRWTLEPGETATFDYPLNPMYDITAPGPYHITARGAVFAAGAFSPVELVSNPVVLTVQASPDYVPPLTVTEADQPFRSFVLWKGWVHTATDKGVFRACTLDRRWQEVPGNLPTGGRFAETPERSPTLYYAVRGRRSVVDGHLTLQSEPALYVATDLESWTLVNRTQDLLRLFLHPNGTLYGISEEVDARALRFRLVMSTDGGGTWQDITGPAVGTFMRISQDPDHPDLVVVDTSAEHHFVLQAADARYQWKPILISEWFDRHPEVAEAHHFLLESDAWTWPAYTFPATMRNYFSFDFGTRHSISALILTTDRERYSFPAAGPKVVTAKIALRNPDKPVKLLDPQQRQDFWGLAVITPTGKRDSRRGAASAAWQAQARHELKPAEELYGPVQRTSLTADHSYTRTLDLAALYPFKEPGVYRVQLYFDVPFPAVGQGVSSGVVPSEVFTVEAR